MMFDWTVTWFARPIEPGGIAICALSNAIWRSKTDYE